MLACAHSNVRGPLRRIGSELLASGLRARLDFGIGEVRSPIKELVNAERELRRNAW